MSRNGGGGDEELARLASSTEVAASAWQPELIDVETTGGYARLLELARSGTVILVDTLADQLAELAQVRHPRAKLDAETSQSLMRQYLGELPMERYGRWVHYSWLRQVSHVLPESDFHELRTSRNRYKITLAEQARLRAARIGVVGLSIGYAIAVTLALEGVGGEFRLADFDRITLSNTNRIPRGVPGLGLNKAVLAARHLYEIDPYLRVAVFSAGLTDDNLDEFLGGQHPVGVLVEECDDLYMKVRIREQARARRIPVIMETNDRGLLDIERFDRDPERAIFHGLAPGIGAAAVRGLTARQKVPFVFNILGGTAMSDRLAASLAEVDQTIVAWSQLASGAVLGGATVTDAVRRMLLGELNGSGRFYVDLESLVSDRSDADPLTSAVAAPAAPAVAARAAASGAHPSPARLPLSREVVIHLARVGSLAPSGGNRQPWRFSFSGSARLDIAVDRERASSFLDWNDLAAHAACGAAAENFRIAAAGLGLDVDMSGPAGAAASPHVCALVLVERRPEAGLAAREALVEMRVTNRRLDARAPLLTHQRRRLEEVAEQAGAELQLVEAPARLTELGELLGAIDRFRFFSEPLYRELMSELRWSARDVQATRDGIDIETLEIDDVDAAGLKLMSRWSTVAILRRVGGTRMEEPARRALAASSALGLLTIDGTSPQAYFRGGIALQRVWLEATALGLALQPMSVAPYLFARLERGSGEGFGESEIQTLRSLRDRFREYFATAPTRGEVLLFRVGVAPQPTKKSLRRPVESVLSFA